MFFRIKEKIIRAKIRKQINALPNRKSSTHTFDFSENGNGQQAIECLLQTCTGIEDHWQNHLSEWHGETRGHFIDLWAIQEFMDKSLREWNVDYFPAFFDLVEEIIQNGSEEEGQNLMYVGLIEGIQGGTLAGLDKKEDWRKWFGPRANKAWDEMNLTI